MSLRQLAFCGASFCAFMFANAAAAQETEVGELVVTGGLEQTLPLELARQGHDLVVVDDQTLRQKAYLDVSTSLQMEVPGLYVALQAGPFSYPTVSLQGSRPQDLLWTIDGIRINNRLYSTTLSDTLPAAMTERIEVLKGGEGLFYGTQAVAGTINIVTRSFSDTFGGEVTVGGDSNDSYHADAFLRGAAGRHKYVAFLSYDQSDGYETFNRYEPSATLRRRGYEVTNGGLKYGIGLAENLSLSASWIHTDAHLGWPGASRVAFYQNERVEDILGLKLDYAPDEGLQFFIKAYHHDWDSLYTEVRNSALPPYVQTVVSDDAYWGFKDQGVNALAKLPVGGFDLLAGYDFQEYEARDEVLIIDAMAEEVHAIFGQVRTNAGLSERFNLGAGIRYNRTGETSATVWNLSGRFDLTPALYLQGNAGSTFTLPTAENLFAIDPFSTFGNPYLEPEEGRSYALSVGLVVGGVEWQVTGFKRDIDNLITFSDDPADIPDIIEAHPDYSGEAYVNAGEAKFEGFEILAGGPIGPAWRWNASYTSTNAEIVGAPGQIQRLPESLAKAGLTWEGHRWGASVTGLWVGDVFQNLAACPAPTCTTPVAAARVNYGDYAVLDLAAHVWLDDDRRHKLTARLQNALDEEYAMQVQRVATDVAGGRFDTRRRGTPQTMHFRYSYRFGE